MLLGVISTGKWRQREHQGDEKARESHGMG
jgi:hypothetical protein